MGGRERARFLAGTRGGLPPTPSARKRRAERLPNPRRDSEASACTASEDTDGFPGASARPGRRHACSHSQRQLAELRSSPTLPKAGC